MTIHLIPLDQIDPNPFQPREQEDPEHVERVARSIEAEGLLQEPLARVVSVGATDPRGTDDVRYQLAFGHTRVAAYHWLNRDEVGFDLMPLKLADLSDLQMFELAVRENSERKDLTPIEEARAMAVYRDRFEKSSEEIGALFGLASSTVRNKLRLLELPEAVQARVGDGLSEGTARSLLTVQKISPDPVVEELSEEIAEGGFTNPESVSDKIQRKLRSLLVLFATNSLALFVEQRHAVFRSWLCAVPAAGLAPEPRRTVLLSPFLSIPCHNQVPFASLPVAAGN